MFSYLEDHLRTLDLKVQENLGRVAEVEIELRTLGAFLQTAHHGVASQLAPYNVTYARSEVGLLIRVCKSMLRKWFDMGLFCVLCRMYYNPILALLAIALLAKVDEDGAGV